MTQDNLYITYSHVDRNIPIKKPNPNYNINDIIGIHISEVIEDGIPYDEIIEICNFEKLKTCQIRTLFEYQNSLIHIASNRFDSNDFYKELRSQNISKIIIDHLYDILETKFGFIYYYINSIYIKEIIEKREVKIIDYEYDKNGDYSYRCRIECTDFNDSYLNSLLLIKGDYSPTCINNFPKQFPGETYSQAVHRVINSTRTNALAGYCKEEHLKQLHNECNIIKQIYLNEKKRITDIAQHYLDYPSPQNQNREK